MAATLACARSTSVERPTVHLPGSSEAQVKSSGLEEMTWVRDGMVDVA